MAVISGVLYFGASFSIVRFLVSRRTVDRETVLGAIATYLMVGMFFAFTYRALGAFQADPFFGRSGDGTFPQDLFFSFTTLTTTGYGNLVPASNPGQSFAVLEMLIGQLFLVTAVAKVVSAWRPGQRGPGLRSSDVGDVTAASFVRSPRLQEIPARVEGARGPDQVGGACRVTLEGSVTSSLTTPWAAAFSWKPPPRPRRSQATPTARMPPRNGPTM